MPYALQQQTQAANPSAADVAAQVRAQVQQQLRDAGVSAQKAKAEADRAAQATKSGANQQREIKVLKSDGQSVVISVPDASPVPLAPLAPVVTSTQVPGIPPDIPLDIPRRVESLGYAFFLMIAVIAVGKPLARALGSLIERRALKPAMPAEFGQRLERIEQGIESVSIEIERISEAQRYLLKVQAPAPAPGRIEIPRSAS